VGLLAGNLLVGWVRRQTQEQFMPTFGVGAVMTVSFVVVFFIGFRKEEPTSSPYTPYAPEKGKTES